MKTDSIKIIFFGTPEIAAYALDEIIKKYNVSAVITQPDKPVGRKKIMEAPPVKTIALQHNIPVFQPEKLLSIQKNLKNFSADMGVVFAFSRIIPKEIIDIFPKGILNIHPSMLPQFRGPSPVQEAILHGLNETGVSIIKLDEKMDHGPILVQKKITINSSHATAEILQQCAALGTKMLLNIIPKYVQNKIILQEQNHEKATYSHIITRENGLIDWKNDEKRIYLQFKAYNPWPGVFTHIEGKRIKILDLKPLRSISEGKLSPGTIFQANNGKMAIQCKKNAILINTLQAEGKNAVSGDEFINGHKNYLGMRLEI